MISEMRLLEMCHIVFRFNSHNVESRVNRRFRLSLLSHRVHRWENGSGGARHLARDANFLFSGHDDSWLGSDWKTMV